LRKPLTLAAVLQQARTILSGLPSTITVPDCRRRGRPARHPDPSGQPKDAKAPNPSRLTTVQIGHGPRAERSPLRGLRAVCHAPDATHSAGYLKS